MEPLSLQKTYAGRHVMLAGASGFLGKVWLAMFLDRLPEIGKIYVLMRRKGTQSALERFEKMISSEFVFAPLHERHGEKLSQVLSKRVEVVEGDVSAVDLKLSVERARKIADQLDLFVNCAGLVEFDPDLRDSIAVNVDGALNAAEFVRNSKKAALLHVSTCYVAGVREGRIPESIDPYLAPNEKRFDPEREYRAVLEALDRISRDQSGPKVEKIVRQEMQQRMRKHGLKQNESRRFKSLMEVGIRRLVREAMIAEGKRRAGEWGWPNIYTYTKGLAESLLATRYEDTRICFFRPAIVESSVAFPFPGWNEGFNTSGPLAYLLGSWFRYLPAKIGNPFDVIPVDYVTNAMSIAGAALILDRHDEVVHCGTSDRNCFTIDRACELTALGHRIHLRQHGKSVLERAVLSRWDAVPVENGHLLSISNLRKVTQGLRKIVEKVPLNGFKWKDQLVRGDRRLEQIEKVLELFMPFTHDTRQVFETKNLYRFSVQEKEFRFAPEEIDWRKYWIDIHMPSLRRWCFPAIEGREKEAYRPVTPVRMTRPIGPPKRTSRSEDSPRPVVV
ncbi:MAG TPA: SDR family oxidoreductase [Bdellovibrionota bacterium]|nr:SDR family oxidoreductase [Bdellovibrionota bacterium]